MRLNYYYSSISLYIQSQDCALYCVASSKQSGSVKINANLVALNEPIAIARSYSVMVLVERVDECGVLELNKLTSFNENCMKML